jgi:hypothetical protein
LFRVYVRIDGPVSSSVSVTSSTPYPPFHLKVRIFWNVGTECRILLHSLSMSPPPPPSLLLPPPTSKVICNLQ